MIPDLKLKMESRWVGEGQRKLKRKYLTKGYYDKNLKPSNKIIVIPPSEECINEIAEDLIKNILNE